MDTRSKKFKYSLFFKAVCFILTVLMFVNAVVCAINFVIGVEVVGYKNIVNNNTASYYDSAAFGSNFRQDLSYLNVLSQINNTKDRELIKTKKDEILTTIENHYLLTRGQIIRAELEYAVSKWDEYYYVYEGDAEDFTTPDGESITFEYHSEKPANIQVAEKILKEVENPIDYNEYDDLIRESALIDNMYSKTQYLSFGENITFEAKVNDIPYDVDISDVRKEIASQINKCLDNYANGNYTVKGNLWTLDNADSLKYYVEDFDGTVTSNIEAIPDNLQNYEHYVLINGKNIKSKGFENINFDNIEDLSSANKICVYFEDDFGKIIDKNLMIRNLLGMDSVDNYTASYYIYNQFVSKDAVQYIAAFAILLVLSILFFIILVSVCGHKNGIEKIKLCFIDKIPVDIQLVITAIISVILPICFIDSFIYKQPRYSDCFVFCLLGGLWAAIVSIFVTSLICSCARLCKSGKKPWECLALIILLKLLFKAFIRIFKLITKGFKAVFKFFKKVGSIFKNEFAYKPTHFKIQVIIYFILYLLVNFLLVILTLIDDNSVIFTLPVFAVFNSAIGYFIVKYVNNLDRIIVASSNHVNVQFRDRNVPVSLKILAENLEDSNTELSKAVAEAVKNEHMKTALITNVSHDLKTPLTSLINYSSLLKECEIDNENANEYINVINTQSEKLKRLIEDLIEASKVSTGNVQLNKMSLSLYELAVQAVVEYTPELEKNGNEVKISENDVKPVVYADSTKTYRIISNLLSNVKKYSAPDTRVYVSVYEDNKFGYLEVKNISKEELNISPDELTERFVRGDSSRTNEGNGLGLSIAKDLCNLQNGELQIKIDGDLFKVTVKLPKNKK